MVRNLVPAFDARILRLSFNCRQIQISRKAIYSILGSVFAHVFSRLSATINMLIKCYFARSAEYANKAAS
jgi:hypothetical protein